MKVKRFFFYYSINRHKMTTLTPSYHAEVLFTFLSIIFSILFLIIFVCILFFMLKLFVELLPRRQSVRVLLINLYLNDHFSISTSLTAKISSSYSLLLFSLSPSPLFSYDLRPFLYPSAWTWQFRKIDELAEEMMRERSRKHPTSKLWRDNDEGRVKLG